MNTSYRDYADKSWLKKDTTARQDTTTEKVCGVIGLLCGAVLLFMMMAFSTPSHSNVLSGTKSHHVR